MELNDKIFELWCKYNSKGVWQTKDGEIHYIETLEDKHLMRLPIFLKRKYNLNNVNEIPYYIIEEIKERNMEIDQDTFYVTKKEVAHNNLKARISIPRINRNRNLFNKLRR